MNRFGIVGLLVALAAAGSTSRGVVRTPDPLPYLIVEYEKTPDSPRVLCLGGDYGFLAHWEENSSPEFFVYDKPKHRITCVTNYATFLEKLNAIPDGASVDYINRCAPPFWQGMPLEQRKEVRDLLKRKGFHMTSPEEGNYPVCVYGNVDGDYGKMTLRFLKMAR
jgi:hypothetical protein